MVNWKLFRRKWLWPIQGGSEENENLSQRFEASALGIVMRSL